ncbi:MAG: ABC transporter substrate-binding protein [Burkholderiales bacterium]|nr:ABC transporter substrate-binding protein [Burkholderiales bacterium]
MDRRRFVTRAVLGGLAVSWLARAQAKVFRIGLLLPGTAEGSKATMAPLEQALRSQGYIEGENAVFERRYANADATRAGELATDLVRAGVDVIVAPATGVAHAAKRATHSIPIVMAATDPVGTGLVRSLAQPGGNVTGLTNIAPEVTGKQIELLREMQPRMRVVAILVNPANPSTSRVLAEADAGARQFDLVARVAEARTAAEIDAAFAKMVRWRADGLVVQGDPLLASERARVVTLAIRHKLPQVYVLREFVDAGGLMSYGASYADILRRVAMYVDKVLRGARPDSLPIEQPTKLELVINLTAAKSLGIAVPQPLLLRAEEAVR